MKLSVLDQSPIISGYSSQQAILESVKLAETADRLGFQRYWLAEHHNMRGLANPCPEILLGKIGSVTEKIRIGSGGVLLPYYNSLKVAETFRMLESLYPGRVDLGIGRAPGGDVLTAKALSSNVLPDPNQFPIQVAETVSWLDGKTPESFADTRITAMPSGISSPEVWLLGSSNYSSSLASHLGLRFAFAHFITAEGGSSVTKGYKQEFQKSGREKFPYSMVCVSVICDSDDPESMAKSFDHRRLEMTLGMESTIQTVKDSKKNIYTEDQKEIIKENRKRSIIGDPDFVSEQLKKLQQDYLADEIMILTVTGSYESRIRSYELIARNLHN